MMYAILGYAMIILLTVLLLTKKVEPIVGFTIVPPVFALIAGYSISEIGGFIKTGVSGAMGTSLLAMMSIIFFSIMTENGLFDPVVNLLVKKAGNNVAVVTVIAAIIAHFSHLDTGTTSTLLVTIPAMLPIFRRLGIDRKYLYMEIVQAIAVMNLLPWGGAITRSSAVTGMEPAAISTAIIPCLIAGFIFNMVTAVIYGRRAQAKINAGILDTGENVSGEDVGLSVESNRDNKVDAKYWMNLVWTLFILFLLFKGVFAGYYTFMLGVAVALIINYRGVKEWNNTIDKYAKNAMRITLVMYAAGIFAGVLNNSAMLEEMAKVIINIIPNFLAPFYSIITGIIDFVFGMLLGPDGFHYGLMPLLLEAGKGFGFAQEGLVYIMCLGRDTVSLITPVQATAWMLAGMCGVEFKDGVVKVLPKLALLFAVEIIVGIVLGIIPVLA